MATVNECKALARLVEPNDFYRVNRPRDNVDYFQSMVIFLYGTLNGIHDVATILNDTKCARWRVVMAVENLTKNKIWKDGIAYVDFGEHKTELENIIEIVLCTMCAMGTTCRMEEEISYPVPSFPLPILPIAKEMLQMLNEVKKMQAERESKPYEFKTYKFR